MGVGLESACILRSLNKENPAPFISSYDSKYPLTPWEAVDSIPWLALGHLTLSPAGCCLLLAV